MSLVECLSVGKGRSIQPRVGMWYTQRAPCKWTYLFAPVESFSSLF